MDIAAHDPRRGRHRHPARGNLLLAKPGATDADLHAVLDRALLKYAPILVLDEPTANLDPETEGEVLDAVYDLARDRATLVISHRLVRMDGMDEILVLEHGRLVERGTHEGLLDACGRYRELIEAQSSMLGAT